MTETFTGAVSKKSAGAARIARFRAKNPDYQAKHNAYKKKRRAEHIPLFVGVDSEGIDTKDGHIAVLLGCGNESIVAANRSRGLHWTEVFEFLYGQFQSHPTGTVFVGFYLKYDFNEWLKSLPEVVARALLSPAGKAARKVTRKAGGIYRKNYRSVHCGGWEIDIIGAKRLSIRPDVCDCHTITGAKCPHDHPPFMHICDAGPFFQTSFLNVIEKWPEVRSDEELEIVRQGKEELRTKARWTDIVAMKKYNTLENTILARCMRELCKGLHELGIFLPRDKWYGPGAVAQTHLRNLGMLRNEELEKLEWMVDFLDAARKSYYGGWFEIFSHGIIKGLSYNYDINSAYPYASTNLPHICDRCSVKRGTGKYTGRGNYVLLSVSVQSQSDRIGAVPYRNSHGTICRPNIAKGWYWKSELDAADRAGLIKKGMVTYEWMEFVPCDHPNPLDDLWDLYDMRLRVGKNTPLGKAIKLLINSIYGKFAQSIGSHPYNNWFYASYITSSCRSQILDAIASHPNQADSVLMVATDGICFDTPHPALTLSTKLGEWEESTYDKLCIFKPGVYWHQSGKEALLQIKSRGVPAKAFREAIDLMEMVFEAALDCEIPPGHPLLKRIARGIQVAGIRNGRDIHQLASDNFWPCYPVALPFRMTSVGEALNQNDWSRAGKVVKDYPVLQNSDPSNKRRDCHYNSRHGRFDSYVKTIPWDERETKYYKDPDIEYAHKLRDNDWVGIDNDPRADIIDLISTARDKEKSNYDIEINEED